MEQMHLNKTHVLYLTKKKHTQTDNEVDCFNCSPSPIRVLFTIICLCGAACSQLAIVWWWFGLVLTD